MNRASREGLWALGLLTVAAAIGLQGSGFWLAQDFRIQTIRGLRLFGKEGRILNLSGSRYSLMGWAGPKMGSVTTFGKFAFSSGRLFLCPDAGGPTKVFVLEAGGAPIEWTRGVWDRFNLTSLDQKDRYTGPPNPSAFYALF